MSKSAAVLGAMVLLTALTACRRLNVPEVLGHARAELVSREGGLVGAANLLETPEGVTISFRVVNMPPGVHGFHIHENGECVPPDFKSAGGHLAMADQRHGFEAPGEAHLGDMKNLEISEDGTAEVERLIGGATLAEEGQRSLLDKAIVIHAEPDDYQSQPSGNAGERIACGVIRMGFAPVSRHQAPDFSQAPKD